MKISELIDRLDSVDADLEVFLENGKPVSDCVIAKHPHLSSNDHVVRICSED